MNVKLNCIEFWYCEERNLKLVPFGLKHGGGGWLRVYGSRKKAERGSGKDRRWWGGDRVIKSRVWRRVRDEGEFEVEEERNCDSYIDGRCR